MKTKTYDAIIDGITECLTITLYCVLWSIVAAVILYVSSFIASLIFESWEFDWLWPILLAVIIASPLTFWSYAQRKARQKFGADKQRDFWMAWGHGVSIARDGPGPLFHQKLVDEMEDWIEENNLGLYRLKTFDKYYQIVFWSKCDAASFKIRWQK